MAWYLRAGIAGLAASLIGCGSDAGSSSDVARPVSERSSAAMLVGTIAVRIGASATGELAEHAGRFLDYTQIKKVSLSIDGKPWGLFPSEDASLPLADTRSAAAGWVLGDERSPALVVAEVGRGELPNEEPPDTVGGWVALLEGHVAPGGHVVRIEEVVLENIDGESVIVRPRLLAPFEVPDGATSAFFGELTIGFDGVGGEP